MPAPRLAAAGYFAAALAISLTISSTGCASVRGPLGPIHPVTVEVRNDLKIPTDLTIYAATETNSRQLLGSVPPGQTRMLPFTPISYTEPYRFVATRAQAGDIVSQPFTVQSEMTGRLIWMLDQNLIGFRDMDSSPNTTRSTP